MISRLSVSLSVICLLCSFYLGAQQFSLKHYSVNEGLIQSDVNKIIQDKNNFIWIATNGGVSRFDGFEIKNYKIPISQIVYDIIAGDEHQIFALMSKGIGMIRHDSIYSYPFDAGMQLGKCRNLVFNDGILWMITNRGITNFDGEHFQVIQPLKVDDLIARWFSNDENKVVCIEDSYRKIWYFANHQHQVFRKKGEEIELIFEAPDDDKIRTLFIDREKQLWIGTQNGFYYSSSLAFTKYFIHDKLGNEVWGIVEDNQRNLWFASFGQGLTKYNGKEFEQITTYKNVLNTDTFYIGSIKKSDGNLLFPTIKGIIQFDGKQFSKVPHLPDQIYLHIYEDTANKTMMYAGENSLVIETKDSVRVFDNLKYNLPQIFSIFKDSNLIYRMGSAENSVFFDGKNFLPPDPSKFGYTKGMYASVTDFKGNVWIATRYGIMLYDYKTCIPILTDEIGETVFDLKSFFGKIYFGTIKAVGLIDPVRYYNHEKSVSYFDNNNGYSGEEVVQNGAVVTSDSAIWIPATRGVSKFTPSRIKTVNYLPSVQIESLISIDRKGNQKTLTNYDVNISNRVDLNYKYRDLEIKYHCIFFSNPEGITYKYKLENYDFSWHEVPFNVRSIKYSQLPAGDYIFKINASNKAGAVTLITTTISISISPPIWQRWWFWLIASTSGLFAAFRLFRTMKKKERKKAEIQQQILKLKADALAAQMNPHFVFNCISSINALINMGDKQEATLYLGRFATLLRSVLKSVRASEITLEEELTMIENYMQLEQARYNKPFNYIIKRPEGISSTLIMIPPLIIHPFVENSILHGFTGFTDIEKRINILALTSGDLLKVVIGDNGSGIKQNKENGIGLGIKITNERIALLESNAHVLIESTTEDHHGTTITISIPLKIKTD